MAWSEWQTPAGLNNQQMQSVGKIARAYQELDLQLPAEVVTAAKALDHLNNVKLDADPMPKAIEEHAGAWLSAAATGKDASTTALVKAAGQVAVLEAQKVALKKARDNGSAALINATRANEEALIEGVRPAFDKAVADLEAATDAIPATMVDLHDITEAGLSKEWIKANDAVKTISHCTRVRDGLRALGVRAGVDQADEYGWLKGGQDRVMGAASIDNLTDRYIALVRKGADLWLSTAAQHEVHYKALLTAKANKQ